MPVESSNVSSSGIALCFRRRSRSVVPPMPRDVWPASDTPCRSSTPRSGSADRSLGSLRRIGDRVFRSEKDGKFTAGAADVACSYVKDRIARPRFAQQKFDALLHRAVVVDVLM